MGGAERAQSAWQALPPIERASYLYQIADRLRASLALQGFESHVQSIAIDGRDTWHRVRLGPLND